MERSPTFSLNEAASILGQTRHTLAKYLADGAPYVTKADRERGVEWQIEIGPLSEWIIERAVNDAVARYQDAGDGSISRAEADRRRAVARAIAAERETEEKLESLVQINDARNQVTTAYAAIRTGLQGVGARVAQEAAPMINAPAIQELVDGEIIATLEGIANGR